ncbi:DNA starvation/stationary phase protection protein [Bacillaceae bacterium Marseille-Q3522]|nr:DNA starvation/stationary phase protection protein [Bacillaceae bacterium Marseille-Q3522]
MSTEVVSKATEIVNALNQQVANWTVLYMKLHHYHWFVKGKHFFNLHEKFEEFYNEADKNIDELAERILALEGQPVSTLKDCLKVSTIEEAKGYGSAAQMVEEVSKDFKKITGELQKAIDLAEGIEDQATGDMFIGMKKSLEKHIWMLKAYLG